MGNADRLNGIDLSTHEIDHHGLRTAWLVERVARTLGLDAATVQSVTEAANLHDVGKHFVEEAVLYKPGRLDAKERREMEMHVFFGAWSLTASETPQPRLAGQVALLHHEWWNGTGYPFGLSGLEIPLAARITAVADVFDALSQERCYKPAWPCDEVLAYLIAQRGRQFDPECAEAMHEVAGRLPANWALQALSARLPRPEHACANVVSLLPHPALNRRQSTPVSPGASHCA
ncbi:HD-GYP domain-containing protein [Roseateles sp.]